MPQEASPAEKEDEHPAADEPGGGATGRNRAARYQYATGDRPLDGYVIKRGVGRGGFGEVYFATSDAGKEVALKLIRRNLDIELRGVRQCLNLKHPNLVALYDLRTDSADDQWVVMEYVSGDSLEDALARHPEGMPVETAIAWLRGIAAGVGYLHASGIVHRDLKPGNIYLERGADSIEQRVKIGDYGLSKFISTSRRSGQTESVGTVHYMAPEISGGRYGREIDTYALGVIFYEMITGQVPFEGESVGEVLMKHLTAEPDLGRVAEPYRSIIARALAKDPEVRISTVEEMVSMLPSDQRSEAATPAAAPAAVVEPEVWTPVSRPPHTDHPVPPREPLWQYGVEMLDEARAWWRSLPLPPLAKGLIFFSVLVMLVVSGMAIAVPLTILPFYVGWYLFWSLFLRGAADAAPTERLDEAAAARREQRARRQFATTRARFNWRAEALRLRKGRTLRQKATTLTGSMLGSAIVCVLAGVFLGPLLASSTGASEAALAAWFAAVSTLGSWGVLVSSSAAQSHFEDHLPRRGMQVLAGAIIGAAAFALMVAIGGSLPYGHDWAPSRNDVLLREAFGVDLYSAVSPSGNTIAVPIAASLAYFGGLFGLVRWWKSTDYIRRRRIGVWSLFATAIGAWLLSVVTWYPQPLGLALAVVIAGAVQICSPWCPPSRRVALARGQEAGGIYDR